MMQEKAQAQVVVFAHFTEFNTLLTRHSTWALFLSSTLHSFIGAGAASNDRTIDKYSECIINLLCVSISHSEV